MTFSEELYFEINVTGIKSQVKKFAQILKSGEFDDFFEILPEYIIYDDDFAQKTESERAGFTLTNDDIPVEIDELDVEDFLEALCNQSASVEVSGHLYDVDDEEYNFLSQEGSVDYINTLKIGRFNDELDEEAYNEERSESDEY